MFKNPPCLARGGFLVLKIPLNLKSPRVRGQNLFPKISSRYLTEHKRLVFMFLVLLDMISHSLHLRAKEVANDAIVFSSESESSRLCLMILKGNQHLALANANRSV